MPVSKEYKQYFTRLVEYKIKQVKPVSEQPQDDLDEYNKIMEDEQTDTENQEEIPSDEVDTEQLPQEEPPLEDSQEEIPDVEDDSTMEDPSKLSDEDFAKMDDVERIKRIQDIQTYNLQQFEERLNDLEFKTSNETESNDEVNQTLEKLQQDLLMLVQKVKDITPSTPEESLEKMPKISGGISIQDYWSNYINQNQDGVEVKGTDFEDDNKEQTYIVEPGDVNLSDNYIKDSLFESKK